MFCDPLTYIDRKPQRIYAQCDYGKQKPFDIIAEKLSAVPVKIHLPSLKDRMLCDPSLLYANAPWYSYPKRANAQKKNNDICPDQP